MLPLASLWWQPSCAFFLHLFIPLLDPPSAQHQPRVRSAMVESDSKLECGYLVGSGSYNRLVLGRASPCSSSPSVASALAQSARMPSRLQWRSAPPVLLVQDPALCLPTWRLSVIGGSYLSASSTTVLRLSILAG